MKGLFKKGIKEPFKWILISLACIGITLLVIREEQNILILAYFISAFLISIFGYSFNKKDWFPFFSIGLPFLLFCLTLFKNNSSLIILLQIFILGGLIQLYGGHLFEFFWNFRNGFMAKQWKELDEESLKRRYQEAKFVVYTLPFFHAILVILSLSEINSLFFREQFGIMVVLSVLMYGFFKNRNKINELPKEIAASNFLVLITIIIFDTILAQIVFLNGQLFFAQMLMFGVGGIAISLQRIIMDPRFIKLK